VQVPVKLAWMVRHPIHKRHEMITASDFLMFVDKDRK
jgi:hypothetical protein